ncbi:toll-like receptor 4 [Amphiura filiformis]|uniref:toll-like receptor 4 n=1 Tax=Amphiura filiformis TaxID=82378 RepID=UPI003B218CA1
MSNNNIEDINRNDFSSLVNLKYMDLSHNAIESLPENQFHHMINLIYLNLAGNKLANLNPLKGLYGLQTLIVYGNAITTLPAFLIQNPYNLLRIEFGDIPFSCNCDIQHLQHWIMTDTKTYIGPQPTYMCKSPAIRENHGITEFSLDCSLHLEQYIAPSVAGLLLIGVIVSVVYKCRWRLHYKCWTLCCQRRYQQYIDNDDDADINSDDDEDVDAPYEAPIMRRRYHAYVAYHKDNEAWVNDQLIANIEDGPERFRLCLKERGDIPAGHYILNAICHGIKQSRKTIAVLSENFMDDGWCHYQLHFARMRMVTDNVDVLILVQIGEIPDCKKTLLLRQLLCYKEVLKWPDDLVGQQLFWNQLKMKLRKPVPVDRRFDEDR